MSFEIFDRKVKYSGSPAMTFTTNGRISFNKSATAIFEKKAVENILLLWDKDKRIIGVRPIIKKDSRAYKVHYGKRGNGCGFSATTFLRHIRYNVNETQSIDTEWDEQEQMFLAELPEELLKKEEVVIVKRKKKPSEDDISNK